jgi:hypothetical protein
MKQTRTRARLCHFIPSYRGINHTSSGHSKLYEVSAFLTTNTSLILSKLYEMQFMSSHERGICHSGVLGNVFRRRATPLRNRHSLKRVRRRCQLTRGSFFTMNWIDPISTTTDETTIRIGLIWTEPFITPPGIFFE